MKHVEISELISPVPIPVKMGRAEKLRHWAALVRQARDQVRLYSGIEYMHPLDMKRVAIGQHDATALGIAAADPVFQAQGLNENTSIHDALRFFELTLHQAHAFSCDCGGAISNTEQASRIERLA